MNEARIANYLLMGMFMLMICAYVFTIQFVIAGGVENVVSPTVSAFCG